MSSAPDPVGTLDVALAHTARLLDKDPTLAAEQAGEILKAAPGHPQARLMLAIAQRLGGDAPAALALLEPLTREQPKWAQAQLELGLALGAAHQGEPAVAALRRAVELKPEMADAWSALGDHLTAMGDPAGADAAYARQIKASTRDPRLLSAASALVDNRLPEAEAMLRARLIENPTDVAAIRMFAEVAARLGRNEDAANLLARCLELAPSFAAARHNYAVVLNRENRPEEALREVERLLALAPGNPGYRNLKAVVLAAIGEYQQAIDIYAAVLAEYPGQARMWMSYGHALKTAGLEREGIAAYRKTVEMSPNLGEAWWSLANLKTFRFEPADVAAMQAQLARTDLAAEDRFHFDFALGKALEDAESYEASFAHYADGNRLRKTLIDYDGERNTRRMQRARTLFTPEFFAERRGYGCPAPDPIFVVGLPRAGSTLLEQILASHSLVEGTMELPDIIAIAKTLGARGRRSDVSLYPEVLANMSAEELRALGERYLAQTRIRRKTAALFFIDKMPNNFVHLGLIQLILPNAKVIDARRHPLGCCFSAFKQHFAQGQHFSFDLGDVGCYYRDYVELMAHFDRVLPGRVHRVIYEQVVEETESEVRRLLAYCGLPFEDACLRFHENARAVRTASSQQVRQPIYRDGLEQWRHYDAWLGPLKDALGPVLTAYPAVPAFSD